MAACAGRNASKPTPTPTASPIPGDTARPATAAEAAIFRSFSPPEGSINGTPDPWILNEQAVARDYALVSFYNTNAGVTAFLVNNSGKWRTIVRTGGQITNNDMLIYVPSMSPTTASNLYALAVQQADGK
jgi:hypothetical protein